MKAIVRNMNTDRAQIEPDASGIAADDAQGVSDGLKVEVASSADAAHHQERGHSCPPFAIRRFSPP
jgi:hypothetical protein